MMDPWPDLKWCSSVLYNFNVVEMISNVCFMVTTKVIISQRSTNVWGHWLCALIQMLSLAIMKCGVGHKRIVSIPQCMLGWPINQ